VTPASGSVEGPRYTLIWQPAAVAGLIRLRTVDPSAAKDARAAIAALAQDPAPEFSNPLGESGLRRLRMGVVRVLYQVDEINHAVQILVVGQSS
jgi:mRNA-degrading endonuclease RelE of RelBE toxin-antitoxin system